MSNFDNSYSGTLSKNGKKEPGSRAPDYKGQLNINGVGHWLSGWIRKGQDGESFLSITAEPKNTQQAKQAQRPQQQPRSGGGGLDDVPFDVHLRGRKSLSA